MKKEISKLPVVMYVNHNWNNNVIILWRSKSGCIYDIADTDIDCDDIEFWFEGIDPLLYYKQLYPKTELPFSNRSLAIAELSYKSLPIPLNCEPCPGKTYAFFIK